MFSFKKKLDQNSENDSEMKEKLFFHDLINQTHGLLLFLNHKEMSGNGIRNDELQLIEKEIKTLQSLIRDHYNLKHKNLVQTYDWVPFSYAKLAFINLSNNFLSEMKVDAIFTMQGGNADEDLIYYPCFYRIINNLIKNISESRCEKVEFKFLLNERGILIETKNSLRKDSNDSSEALAHLILEEKKEKIKSLGLDSIHHLAEEHGGAFNFEIENNYWINKVFLPTKGHISKIKTDKIAA